MCDKSDWTGKSEGIRKVTYFADPMDVDTAEGERVSKAEETRGLIANDPLILI